jgi:hypothetical protein
LLSWNLGGQADAREALLNELARPECRWAVALIQEWVPYDDWSSYTADVVTTALNAASISDWTVAAVTTCRQHKRRSALLVRTKHPHRPAWPIRVLKSGDHPTSCWALLDYPGPVPFKLLVSNVHGTSHRTARSSAERSGRMQTTLDELAKVQKESPTAALVAGGDWNAEPWSEELTFLSLLGAARHPAELRRTVGAQRAVPLYNPTWSLAAGRGGPDPAGTYWWKNERGVRDRWKLFDQFLLNAPAAERWLPRGTLALAPELSGHPAVVTTGPRLPATTAAAGPVKPASAAPCSDHVPVSLVFR